MSYKFVSVVFQDSYGDWESKEYHFNNIDSLGLEVGDLVVVETRYGYQVAKIVNFTNVSSVNVNKYVIQKIDTETYLEAQVKEIEKRELNKALEDRLEYVTWKRKLEDLSQHDEVLAGLVAQLHDLEG